MPITFFELLAPVINKNVTFVANQHGIPIDQVYENIVAEATRNQAEWYSNRVPNLNYHNPDCRLAYLHIVAAVNANTFKYILETNEVLRNYILQRAQDRSELKVCALGAGPGTELLAMAKFFDQLNLGYSVSVDFQLLDKVEEWASSWYGIRDEINNAFRQLYGNNRANWPVIPSGNLLGCDVTALNKIPHLGNIWGQDIYVINFLLSEIFNDNPGLRAFLSQVANLASPGAKFVFIERRGSIWQNRMNGIAQDAGLQLSPFIESKRKVDADENPENLGDIYRAIGARKTPRLSWNIVYSIGEKV